MATTTTAAPGDRDNKKPAAPSSSEARYTEVDCHNPRSHRADYFTAAGGMLVPDDARHGAVWQAVLAPQALYARVMHAMASTFLPVGYPHSVREEYLAYQGWDTVQALCSYLRGILTTKAILEGSGVGSEKASALSAAVNWVFRDGVGMACSLVFSSLAATSFDGNIKEWRLFADVINDVGLTLDMLTAIFRSHFLLLTCLSTVCKTMCGVAAGCTKSSITAHFAVQGNIADVAAKENAQETFVTLIGIVGGLMFAHSIADPSAAWPVFIFLTLLHVFANYMGVSALRLYTLNTQRAALVIDNFIKSSAAAASNTRAYDPVPLLTPHETAKKERVWQPLLSWLRGDQPHMGVRVRDLVGHAAADVEFLLKKVYPHERYALTAHPQTGRVLVLLRQGAGPQDELKAFFQAQALRHLSPDFSRLVQQEEAKLAATATTASGSSDSGGRRWPTPAVTKALLGSYEMTVHRFPAFLRCLERKPGGGEGEGAGAAVGAEGWETSRMNFGTSGWRLLAEGKKHK